jgi:hypothetical protein
MSGEGHIYCTPYKLETPPDFEFGQIFHSRAGELSIVAQFFV